MGNNSQQLGSQGLSVGMAACVAVLVSACGKQDAPVEKPLPIRPVKTMVLGTEGKTALRTFPGRVKASKEVNLAFEVAGRIVELPIMEGTEVKEGHLLARLDQTDFENTVSRERAKRDNAKANFERAERLVESGSVSRMEFDRRKAAYEMADAELRIAEKALQNSSLTAPFTGLVARKYVDNHQYVQAKHNILSLQDVTHIEIVVDIPEDLIAWTKSRGQINIMAQFEAAPGKDFPVTVKEFGTQAHPQTQTFPVTLTMMAPANVRILPGMTASITAEFPSRAGTREKLFLVPESAVFADEHGRPHIWVVDQGTMTAKKRAIKTGDLSGAQISVTEGLDHGDMIITAGVDHVRQDMKVSPLAKKPGDGR